jgi:hypothetical protein
MLHNFPLGRFIFTAGDDRALVTKQLFKVFCAIADVLLDNTLIRHLKIKLHEIILVIGENLRCTEATSAINMWLPFEILLLLDLLLTDIGH